MNMNSFTGFNLVGKVAIASSLALASMLTLSTTAFAATFQVIVENLSPENGTFVTPVWFGIHNGDFDLFNVGETATEALERLAEDGTVEPLNAAFDASGNGTVQGVVTGPGPFGPGNTRTTLFTLDAKPTQELYFSYAAMVVPSNDAFIANANAEQFKIFDDAGKFVGVDFVVSGERVWDAGTEVNDELASTTAFLGQSTPDTGTPEGGTVQRHPGFVNSGRILTTTDFNGLNFTGADFTAPGYNVVRIRVEKVPEPGTVLALLTLGGSLIAARRRQTA